VKQRAAAARFFIRIGQVEASQPWRDEATAPLFPLPLIMAAEGLLARDASYLTGAPRCRAPMCCYPSCRCSVPFRRSP
jgi:hypothetical protein